MDNNANVIDSTAVEVSSLSLGTVLGIPAVRQVMLLVGVAAAVAAGFAVALWAQSPGYTPLYPTLEASEAADVAGALQSAGVDYKIDPRTGNVLVAEAALHSARLSLASQGMSPGDGSSILAIESDFGTSQFMESARYQHALEAELGRTIASLGAVREARVHLALPKQTAFIRDRKAASASVLLHLFRGRSLEPGQAAAIVNLVANSVPDLAPGNVTLVDQWGSLLSSGERNDLDVQATSRFNHTQRVEENLKRRIENLLTPLVGHGRVRAQVAADMDFTLEEAATESFTAGQENIISERVNERNRVAGEDTAAGVPGALSNQPPGVAAAPPVEAGTAERTVNLDTDRATNYQPNRELRYQRSQPGQIRRLSVAVLVDDSPVLGEENAAPLTAEDLERYTSLVREAVGFDEARGDTVVVINEPFRAPAEVEAPAAPPIWEQPAVKDIARLVLGALVVLAIAFGVVRPMLTSMLAGGPASGVPDRAAGGVAVSLSPSAQPQLAGAGAGAIPGPSYDEKVAAARNITGHDPARVAQVVRKWVATED